VPKVGVKSISIVVAVYKNELSIQPFLSRLEKVIHGLAGKYKFEVIVVNDGTPDQSMREIDSFIKKTPRLKIVKIELSRNFGQLNAILAGISVSISDAIINISADLQDPPELIPEMLENYKNGNKIVICARKEREDGFIQKLTSSLGYYLLGRGEQKIPKGGFDYFLLDREPVMHLLALKGRFRFIQGDILGLGFNPIVIRYARKKRIYGKSSYTFLRRLRVFLDSFVDISFLPLKLVTRIGFLISLAGFLVTLFSLLSYGYGNPPFTGFTAIFVAILIFGGLQMMAIGLIGEYIFRIYDLNRGRPTFIIKKD